MDPAKASRPARAQARFRLPTSLLIPHPHLAHLDSRALEVQRRLKRHDPALFMTIDGPPDPRTRHEPIHRKRIIPKRYTVWRLEPDGRTVRIGNFPLDELDAIYMNILALDRTTPSHEDSTSAVERHNDRLRKQAEEQFVEAGVEETTKTWWDSGVVLHRYRHFFPVRANG